MPPSKATSKLSQLVCNSPPIGVPNHHLYSLFFQLTKSFIFEKIIVIHKDFEVVII